MVLKLPYFFSMLLTNLEIVKNTRNGKVTIAAIAVAINRINASTDLKNNSKKLLITWF